jgi:hypothetical protein
VSELDRLREQIAYLKYAQGVFVVVDISVAGWLLSASDEPTYLNTIALIGVVVLSLVILGLHRQIERCIERIGKL